MKSLITFLFILMISSSVKSQVYVEGGKTRHRFAQLNVGFDVKVFGSNGTKIWKEDALGAFTESPLSKSIDSRIVFGGTHFWGHADFYVAVPVMKIGKSGFKSHVETGARYYPWPITSHKLRPFVAVSAMPMSFKSGAGVDFFSVKTNTSLGFTYALNDWLFHFEAAYTANNQIDYYYTITEKRITELPTYHFTIGLKKSIETTLGAEKNSLNGRTKYLTDTLAQLKRLNGFTIGLGLSSAFSLGASNYNSVNYQFLDEHKVSSIFMDFGIGYYFHSSDIQLNMAYRANESTIEAFTYKQSIKRKSIALEAYKFLGDYHGFVPFLGFDLAYEILDIDHQLDQLLLDEGTFNGLKPGLVFGWDIRPNRLQSFILRTNIRYFPKLNMAMQSGSTFRWNQLEINFIQLVVFPGRMFGHSFRN